MAFEDKLRIGIKLLFSKDKELYSFCYRLLGYCPRDLSLYKQAFRHRSLPVRSKTGKFINNERLEYLGDAVLNAVVADLLYTKYRYAREGFLTNTRSKIVSREMLNALAEKNGLVEHLEFSRPVHTHNCSMGGNALEALIGAAYLDLGYARCRECVVNRLIFPHISLKKLVHREVNFKSRLIEWGQKNKADIVFELEKTEYDADRSPVFYTVVRVAGLEAGSGKGYTKKESQQEAAKEACRRVEKDGDFRSRCLENAGAQGE